MNDHRMISYSMTAPEIFARFIQFRSQGRVNPKVGDFSLGIGIRTIAALGNYVELRFDIIRDSFEEYRIRRWIDDEEGWQRLVGGFARTHSGGMRDDMPPGFYTYTPRQFTPPDIYDFDSPGIPLLSTMNRSIVIQRGIHTDPSALEFLWIVNFRDWVEGRRGQNWRRISAFTPWTSVFSVVWRDSNMRWEAGPRGSASTGRTKAYSAGREIRLVCTS